jgi:hypothetical protein
VRTCAADVDSLAVRARDASMLALERRAKELRSAVAAVAAERAAWIANAGEKAGCAANPTSSSPEVGQLFTSEDCRGHCEHGPSQLASTSSRDSSSESVARDHRIPVEGLAVVQDPEARVAHERVVRVEVTRLDRDRCSKFTRNSSRKKVVP